MENHDVCLEPFEALRGLHDDTVLAWCHESESAESSASDGVDGRSTRGEDDQLPWLTLSGK